MRFNDVIKSPKDKRDFVLSTEQYELPKTYDLREFIRGVLDQGSEGSCSAHAVAIVKEVHEAMNEGLRIRFSPDYIYCQRENRVSEGMTPRDTMKLLSKGSLPARYWKHRYNKRIPNATHELASQFSISGYATVDSATALQEAIHMYGAAYIATPVYNSGMWMWNKNKGDKLLGGHALSVVGWDEKAFIIQNSWGYDWGDNGYTYLPFSDFGKIWEAWVIVDGDTADMFKKNGKLTKEYRKAYRKNLKKS